MNHAVHPTPPTLSVTTSRWPKLARITPAIFSLLIHGAFFIYFGAPLFDNGSLQTKLSPISVHLLPAPAPTAIEPRKVLPSPPMPVRPTPSTPKPSASVIKKAVTSTVKPPVKIAFAPAEPSMETPTEPATETSINTPPATSPTVITSTPALPNKEQQQLTKQTYLAALMAHIESHKHYPRAARQRRMEGQTTVKFTLLASGEVCEISISNGPKLLRIASKTALQKALPLPKPPNTLDYPMVIQFDMEYRLI